MSPNIIVENGEGTIAENIIAFLSRLVKARWVYLLLHHCMLSDGVPDALYGAC